MEALPELVGFPFLALLGGYIFVANCNFTAFWCAQSTDHRLYFASAIAAALFVCVARILMITFSAASFQTFVLHTILPPAMVMVAVALPIGGSYHMAIRLRDVTGLSVHLRNIDVSSQVRNLLYAVMVIAALLIFGLVALFVATALYDITLLSAAIAAMVLVGTILILATRLNLPWRRSWQMFFILNFRAAVALAIVAVISFVIAHLVPIIAQNWDRFSMAKYSGLYTGAAIIGAIAWIPCNVLLPREYAKWRVVKSNAEDILEAFLWVASNQKDLVQINLANGKIYIGYVVKTPARLDGPHSYVRFQPVASGHRNPETQRLNVSTFYQRAYQDYLQSDKATPDQMRTVEQLQKIVSTDEIWATSYFDPKISSAFGANGSARPSAAPAVFG